MSEIKNDLNPLGLSADQILDAKLIGHSSYHFFQAKSWLDFARRKSSTSSLQYAALELRYGLEYLLFELLVLANPELDQVAYQRALKGPSEMRKMLESHGPKYSKLVRFTELVVSFGPAQQKLHFWELSEIFKVWGKASSYLHFFGPDVMTSMNSAWREKAETEVGEILEPIWSAVTERAAVALLRPTQMEPEVAKVWEQFVGGAISDEQALNQLREAAPILSARFKNQSAK